MTFNDSMIVYKDDNGKIWTNDEMLNNIIRDTESETGEVLQEATPGFVFEGEDPDQKVYLVLLSIYNYEDINDDAILREWSIKIGRQATYDYLKDLVKYEAIDPNTSFIIAGSGIGDQAKPNVKFDDVSPITVFRFLKVMREGRKVIDNDDMFDINDHDNGVSSGDKTIIEV